MQTGLDGIHSYTDSALYKSSRPSIGRNGYFHTLINNGKVVATETVGKLNFAGVVVDITGEIDTRVAYVKTT